MDYEKALRNLNKALMQMGNRSIEMGNRLIEAFNKLINGTKPLLYEYKVKMKYPKYKPVLEIKPSKGIISNKAIENYYHRGDR